MTLRRRVAGNTGARGQGLAEFALIVPVLLLLTLIAIDFGRVYLGWVNLQNMARVAANYAANNPTAWTLNDTAKKATYQNDIRADAKQNNCTLPLVSNVQTAPDPVFPGGTLIGGTAVVNLSCTFTILTPIISNVFGGGVLTVSASSTFPIKTGQFAISGGTPVAPVAAFIGSPVTIVNGSSVVFTDNSSGVPTSWAWTFGDSSTSTTRNNTHAYTLLNPAVAQTFTVSLTVSNAVGSNTLTKSGYITVNPAPLTANFTATPVSGARPLAVQFTDTSTGVPAAWAWNFGDGGTSTSQNPVRTYANAGLYTVTLTVTSATGTNTITRTNYINVTAGTCTVPPFINTSSTNAQVTWNAAGFTTTVNFQQGGLPWTIRGQTLTGGSAAPCNSNITLSRN